MMSSRYVTNAPSNNCADLSSPSYTNFSLSILIVIGILISYLPQHHRIISRRSSEGISPYFVLLGFTSGTCAFANILTLPISRRALACCKDISGFECAAGLLGIAQIGVQWLCFTVILLLFLLFFPTVDPLETTPPQTHSYRTAIAVFTTSILHAFLTFTISLFMIYLHPASLRPWAYFLGILGTILAAIQFLPQIYTTWRLQHVGSLSIPMMCIQTPGSFVWVGSLAKRLGWDGWSTWGIYLVTGVLQGIVLGMAISFEIREGKRKRQDKGNSAAEHAVRERDETNERTALLGNEQ